MVVPVDKAEKKNRPTWAWASASTTDVAAIPSWDFDVLVRHSGTRECYSLRTRLRLGTIAGTSLVLAGSACAIYLFIRQALIAEFDATLSTQTRMLTTLVERHADRHFVVYNALQFPEYAREDNPEYFCYWHGDGKILNASPSLLAHGGALPRLQGSLASPVIASVILPDGQSGRAAGVRFRPRQMPRSDHDSDGPSDSRDVELTIARSTAHLANDLSHLGLLLTGISLLAVAATVLVLEFVIRLLMVPVDRLAGRIANLDVNRLIGQLHAKDIPIEMAPLVQRLNNLLVRLQADFLRERGFNADLAHELRTPLAGLRTTIEVTIARERSAGEYRNALADCLVICLQTQGMVDTLLALTRADSGQLRLARVEMDLALVLEQSWNLVASEAASRRLERSWLVNHLTVMGDAEQLRLVFINLFANAAAYAEVGSTVEICLHEMNDRRVVTVANTGCDLTPDQAKQVFDRFWRGDRSRTATGLHCGLGLTLCRTLVGLHGGTITASVQDGRFTITVSLPPR